MRGEQWTTCVGTFADSCGAIRWQNDEVKRSVDRRGQEHLSVTRHVELAHQPAASYASYQPATIPARWRHGGEIGRVVLLDRRQARFAAVAVLQGPVEQYTDRMPELFWSSGTRDDGELELTEISLTPEPATIGLPPVQFYPGLPHDAKGYSGAPWSMLNRADEVMKGTYNPMEVRCRFDDLDRARSDLRAAEPMELFYSAPIGRVLKVNGRPPRGMRR